MGRFRLIAIRKASITQFVYALLMALLVVHINIFYFADLDLEEIVSTNLFNYLESGAAVELNSEGKLAIIIDDFGQNRNGVKEMMSIDRHLTFAVMPFLSFTNSDADNGYKKGYEIIVHLPMEAYTKLGWVGPKPILSVMNDIEIQQIVNESFESVPHAVGANIHMGSKAGDDRRIISEVLDVIKYKGVYFVDSRASRHPIAKNIASEKGVLCYDRDIFLDGKKSKAFIKKQLRRAGEIALTKGKAIAIGHVGTEGGKVTAEAIREMLPEFDKKNIELVFISELGNQQ